jgi:hypothetical protein
MPKPKSEQTPNEDRFYVFCKLLERLALLNRHPLTLNKRGKYGDKRNQNSAIL